MNSNNDLAQLSDLPLEVENFANVGVWHYYTSSDKVIWSSSLHKIYEVNEHEFKGTFKDYINYLHPDDVDSVKSTIEHGLKTQNSFSFDKRIITANGNSKFVRNWGIVIKNEDNNPIQVTFLSMDITESIKAEQSLRESDTFNEKLVRHTPNAILVEDVNSKILFANKTCAELLKAPSVEYLIGKNASEFRITKSKKEMSYTLRNILKSGRSSPKIDIDYRCLDGSIKTGEFVAVPFEYKGQESVLIIVNDITQQKKALKDLKNSERQLLHFIENTPAAVAMYDLNMNYITCSEQFIKDWWVSKPPVTPKDIVGKNHYEIFPDTKNEWKKFHNSVLAGETLSEENDHFVKKNGKKEWLKWKAQPWYKGVDEIGGLILFTEFITDRKEAEDAVKESRNRLNTLIQNLPGLVYRSSVEGFELLFVSSGCYKLTGYKEEEFFGNNKITFVDIVHPDDLDKVRQSMVAAFESGNVFEVSYRIFTKSGEQRYFNERGQVLFSDEGEPLTYEGFVSDITESTEAEKALRNSKESLDEAQRVSHLGSWEWYLEDDRVFWSDEYYRICGEEPGAFTPDFEKGEIYIHPDDRDKIRAAVVNTAKTGEPYKLDTRIVRKDGSIRYVTSRAELVKNENEEPIKVIGSMQDITEQKLTAMALAESQKRNLALIHALPDLMIIATRDGVLIDIEVSDKSLLFKPIDELIGMNIKDLLNAQDGEEFVGKSEVAVANGENQIVEYSIQIDGAEKFYEARIVNYGENKILAVIRDITKNKEDERQLIELTEELSNSNAELKQFAYITSHDLRSPVVNLDTLLKFYQADDISSTEKEDLLDKIVGSVDQLKSTLNDLIQLVSIKDHDNQYLAEVNLEEVVQAVIGGLETQINAENAIVNMDFSECQYVTCRRSTVYSIIQNLISNSLKYRGKKDPVISISSSKDEGYVVLSIEDNGLGIDLDKNGNKLFGMYQRFHENKEGKGLGLYIIKSQIEAMGGFIDVKSEVGEGTEFKVCFKQLKM